MPKHKPPTPQELYWARKQAQEAYLPPGLINHGNTCFMNSVLQGLIATRVLAELAQFNEIPEAEQRYSSTPLLARRSPQLTNGHRLGGQYEQPWVNMPIGDRFMDIMLRSWGIQSQRKRESLSPKDLLAAVGQKYDQYLDFAQQDAHEFLRILLDAMRMEEQDVIKRRQPPPPKQPRKRRRSSQPSEPIPTLNSPGPSPSTLPPEDALTSFSDMIFGGKLTSILVCQKCKHISQTYEDFNDISLSLKPEDYAVLHSRKRHKLKMFAKKLAALPTTSLVASTNPSNAPTQPVGDEDEKETNRRNGIDRMEVALQIQRSSSVPPSPREREDPQISEKPLPYTLVRRRSMEHLQSDQLAPSLTNTNSVPKPSVTDQTNGDVYTRNGVGTVTGPNLGNMDNSRTQSLERAGSTHEPVDAVIAKETESDGSNVVANNVLGNSLTFTGEKHVEFVPEEATYDEDHKGKENDKKDKKKLDFEDSWTKISRRISMTVGLGRRDKDKDKKRSRSADRRVSSSPLKPKFSTSGSATTTSLGTAVIESDSLTPDLSLTSTASDPHTTLENYVSPPPPPPSTAIEVTTSLPVPLPQHPPNSAGVLTSQPTISTPKAIRSFSSQSHTLPRLATQLQSVQKVSETVQKIGGIQRSKSPKPPKQTKEEQEFLRRILADVGPTPVRTNGAGDGERNVSESGGGNPLARLKHTSTRLHPPSHRSRSQPQTDSSNLSSFEGGAGVGNWLPLAAMSQFTGLEECLRMFTAVEVLDGENMVGCRRCWKIQNGYLKGEGGIEEKESDDEGEEGAEKIVGSNEKDGEGNRMERAHLAPPLMTFDSQSSTSSVYSFESDHTPEDLGTTMETSSNRVIPYSLSTPTLTPVATVFSPDLSLASSPPPLPHRPSSSSQIELRTEPKHTISRSPLSIPTPTELHSCQMPPPDSSQSEQVLNTPGGLPIPRISTTPAVDAPSSYPHLDGIILGTGAEDTSPNGYDSERGGGIEERNAPAVLDSTPSSSSRSSLVLDEEVAETDEEVKKRRGMIFSDSLIVPRRMPGRSGLGPKRRGTSTDGDGVGSEADMTSPSTSRSASISGTLDSSAESESAESEEENVLDPEMKRQGGPAVPPGLEGMGLSPPQVSTTTVAPPPRSSQARVDVQLSPSNSTPKPKRKKETIPRAAYKRYLISIPPPVLVIHLKRFQQLHTSSATSGLASFAEKIAAGFSTSTSGLPGSYGSGGGRGFGGGFGFGGGGFKKLEEFVSFPEWLDLSPFLEPRKEDVIELKRVKSELSAHSKSSNKVKEKDGRDEEGRCMYRLYAVVVHIGNMLGGHYIAYVALPSEPPLTVVKIREKPQGAVRETLSEEEASAKTSPPSRHYKSSRQAKRQWAYISDTTVRLVSLEEVLNARAYMCMYERV